MKKSTKVVKKSAPQKVAKIKDITEIVVDYKSACKVLKRKPVLPDLSIFPKKHQKATIAFIILTTIIEAWNEGWIPDFTNSNEYKYFVWNYVKKDKSHVSGFGFSSTAYDYANAATGVGSRLCFKSSDLAIKAAKKFEELYKDYFFIPK